MTRIMFVGLHIAMFQHHKEILFIAKKKLLLSCHFSHVQALMLSSNRKCELLRSIIDSAIGDKRLRQSGGSIKHSKISTDRQSTSARNRKQVILTQQSASRTSAIKVICKPTTQRMMQKFHTPVYLKILVTVLSFCATKSLKRKFLLILIRNSKIL